jgi:parvulin-like peptidyl-prolyl isomerase
MKRILFFGLLVLILTSYGFAQSFDSKTLATVSLHGFVPIKGIDFRKAVEILEKEGGQRLSADQRQKILDEMINEELILQGAAKEGIKVTDNDINMHIQELRNQLRDNIGHAPTPEEFAYAFQTQFKMDEKTYRENYRKQTIFKSLLSKKKGPLLKTIETIKPPTETEILYEYNKNRQSLVRLETIEFSGIQIPFGPDAASRTKAKDLGNKLSLEIGSDPSKFNTAFDRAPVPNSGYRSGKDIVPNHNVTETVYGKGFIETAFNLKDGQVSKLIEGKDSYFIIKVTTKLDFKNLEIDDIAPSYLIPPQLAPYINARSGITVRNLISAMLFAEKQMEISTQAINELISELRAGKTYEILEKNLTW